MQKMTTKLQEMGEGVGLYISSAKTKAMIIGDMEHPNIRIGHEAIEYVSNFPYLGSYMEKDGGIEMDVRTRIGKAAAIFQRMRTVWRSGVLNRDTKIRLYSALVLPVVLYASETWKTTAKTTKQP